MLLRTDLRTVGKDVRSVHRDQCGRKAVPERTVLLLSVRNIGKRNFRAGKQKPGHDAPDVCLLLCVGFQKFQPRGHIEKEIFHRDDGSPGPGRRPHNTQDPSVAGERIGVCGRRP